MKLSDIFKRNLVRNLLLLIPGIVIYNLIGVFFKKDPATAAILDRVVIIYIIIIMILVCNSILMAISDAYGRSGKNRNIPLKGLFQALQVVVYFIGGIIIIAVLLNKSPSVLLTGLGASAAVLMLVFKDSILGLVAGVQLSQNKMIRIGDWIQLPDGSANGTVEEITLNTVKVRNWDNTLTMIPPYTLVSSPFKNWRGMQESGGRRADKCIYIDMTSLEICSGAIMERVKVEFPIMEESIRRMGEKDITTNIQLYRAYIETFLRQHQDVNTELDIIVTQKEATAYGLPIEVYFFTKEKAWALYEKQQSDIFDHLMTMAPEFGLRIYQRP